MEIPRYIYDLYMIAKESFTLYEQGERLRSIEFAYQLRDVADHLVIGSQQTDQAQANLEFQQVADHLMRIAIDPLQRATQRRVLRINGILQQYGRHRLIHDMPDPYYVEQTLELVDIELEEGRRLKGRIDPTEARHCFEHMQEAYTLALNTERTLNNALQSISIRVQLIAIIATVSAFILAIISIILSLIPLLK
ncbi:MAG: hypothetical protein M3441_04090 [Chloroflexota bacterium]|nr:hypothetical protein [Chloroflexota bacterium]